MSRCYCKIKFPHIVFLVYMHNIQEQYFNLSLSIFSSCFLMWSFLSFFSSVRLRRNDSIRKPEHVSDLKKGQRLIEKETMETGQVIQVLGLFKYLFQ